jgi:hypothetical protein
MTLTKVINFTLLIVKLKLIYTMINYDHDRKITKL